MKTIASLPDKLHLGCFDQPLDGWHNTDITPHLRIARIPGAASLLYRLGKMNRERFDQHREGIFRKVNYLHLGKSFPYPKSHFKYVFSCHVFEHIPRPVLAAALREILRVMKSGGTMRIVIPDLTWFVARYSPDTADEFVKGVFEIEHGMEKNRHHWMYSFVSMKSVLEAAGFVNVSEKSYRIGSCPDIDQLDNRPDHSIFMEAEKP